MDYVFWLLGLSVAVAALERWFAARNQKVLRTWLWSDAIHLVFNAHIFGMLLYAVAHDHILPHFDSMLIARGWQDALYFNAADKVGLGLLSQSILALVVIDFVQWVVHNLLHRFSFLWRFHQVHHSVQDGEMDWMVSFRFSWFEPLFYKSLTYLPIMWFGFAPEALFVHAVVGTLIGHLNHANLSWDYGVLGYVLNNPKMHLYHHAYDAPQTGQNFGIIFSVWDHLFGTAHVPQEPCPKIGFPGDERIPKDFFGQFAWPLQLWAPNRFPEGTNVWGSLAGLGLLLLFVGVSIH